MPYRRRGNPESAQVLIASSLFALIVSWLGLLLYALHYGSVLLTLFSIALLPVVFFSWMGVVFWCKK